MQKRALIVDDERSNCELLERVLVGAGVEPVTVDNGPRPSALCDTAGS